jgi:hypothetical protein
VVLIMPMLIVRMQSPSNEVKGISDARVRNERCKDFVLGVGSHGLVSE